jgi:hypothetical protein
MVLCKSLSQKHKSDEKQTLKIFWLSNEKKLYYFILHKRKGGNKLLKSMKSYKKETLNHDLDI